MGSRTCPNRLAGRRYYQPTDRGLEADLRKRIERIRRYTSRPHRQKGPRVTTFVEPIRRSFDRTVEQARPISIQPGTMPAAPEGSATISLGNTVVLCAATVEERVPKWISAWSRLGPG